MLGHSSTNQKQLNLFGSSLLEQLDPNHPLIQLANTFPWHKLEKELASYYSHTGNPSHPIRKMVALLLLQHIFNYSDERIVEVWKENPYYQYFTGEASLCWSQPAAASDLVHFRKRIGEKGIRFIFSLTVSMHINKDKDKGKGKPKKLKEVLVDTTVQEKHITYPTDAKLYKKIIDTCNKISKKLSITYRQSYKYISQKLMYWQGYIGHASQAKRAKKALSKLKTLAGRQVKELARNLVAIGKEGLYAPILARMKQILLQRRESKNKLYSLHEPGVSCIAKGKKGKKYEFGSKVSIASLPSSGLIVAIESFEGNPHDSHTLVSTLEAAEQVIGSKLERVIVDRGYRGSEQLWQGEIVIPAGRSKELEKGRYSYRIHKRRCKSRSGIEGLISHLKNYHKLGRNYLRGVIGDRLNCLLTAIGHNVHLLLLAIQQGKGSSSCINFLLIKLSYPTRSGNYLYTYKLGL